MVNRINFTATVLLHLTMAKFSIKLVFTTTQLIANGAAKSDVVDIVDRAIQKGLRCFQLTAAGRGLVVLSRVIG
jgi:hypothetical protein